MTDFRRTDPTAPSIAHHWSEYESAMLRDAPTEVVESLKHAFYCGANAGMTCYAKARSTPAGPIATGVLGAEIRAYLREQRALAAGSGMPEEDA